MIVAGLIAVAWCNVGAYTAQVFSLRTATTNIEGWERLWEPMHSYLMTADYRIGDLGFVSSTSLRSGNLTAEDVEHRIYLYYAVIPLNLIENKLDAPYVVGDFLGGKPDTLPPGLIEVFDAGNGLVLLKNTREK